ncbi:xanthine dehydrogenase molybdopterin binding subunit [Rhodovulum sp. DZ06]|uniref:xanthine dehydrogenase molybdopterin binding subunit n=1 Tax=Rhodovulum sp. DZ06 TaxID=3425126 RepID=UPI003D339536
MSHDASAGAAPTPPKDIRERADRADPLKDGEARPITGGAHAPQIHDSAVKQVQGAASYIDDIPAPAGCLHIAFGGSPVAHGRLRSVNLDAVRAAEGVVAVLTAADIPGRNDCSTAAGDEELLATETLHYHMQPVFAVVATSHLLARRAARLAEWDVEELPALVSVADAVAAQSFFDPEPYAFLKGDPAPALAAAPHRLKGRVEIGGQEHFYLETQIALAIPGEDMDVKVHSSTQHPTEIQHKVAEVLGTPYNAVEVEVRRMGGGFGGKESQGNAPAQIAAVAAKALNRPVKIRYDRDDDMSITGKRHDFVVDYDVAFDDAGRIEAVIYDQYARCGWSMDLSLPVCDRAMFHADNAYYLPHARINSYRCRTNTCSNTAFRGFGGPQGLAACERMMDHIAHVLGKDPLEVRKANLYDRPGGARVETPYGMEVKDNILHELIPALEEQAGYAARREEIAAFNARSKHLKKGIALTPVKFGISFTLTHMNQAAALVHVYTDGSIHLNHGGTEMGQGLFVKCAQVAAEAFQVDVDRIKITPTNTGKAANTSPTAASSGTDVNGMATLNACEAIKARMAAHAAALLGGDAEAVEFRGGRVFSGARSIAFADLAKQCWMARIHLSSTGHYATPDIHWDRPAGKGKPFYYFAYGAAVTEAAVDLFTGEYRLTRAHILHDAGRSLNPAVDLGQIEGAYVQGAGWLTTEELVWDPKGRLWTHAPSTYKIPTASDRPAMEIRLWHEDNPRPTIHKSKAVGEPPLMLGVSAWLALSDACAACGPNYPDLSAPATPERVLAAIARAKGTEW